jgi:hypothetical protein
MIIINISKAQIRYWKVTETQLHIVGHAGGNVTDETEILLIGVLCKVCEQ